MILTDPTTGKTIFASIILNSLESIIEIENLYKIYRQDTVICYDSEVDNYNILYYNGSCTMLFSINNINIDDILDIYVYDQYNAIIITKNKLYCNNNIIYEYEYYIKSCNNLVHIDNDRCIHFLHKKFNFNIKNKINKKFRYEYIRKNNLDIMIFSNIKNILYSAIINRNNECLLLYCYTFHFYKLINPDTVYITFNRKELLPIIYYKDLILKHLFLNIFIDTDKNYYYYNYINDIFCKLNTHNYVIITLHNNSIKSARKC